jgi:hypothetical protein
MKRELQSSLFFFLRAVLVPTGLFAIVSVLECRCNISGEIFAQAGISKDSSARVGFMMPEREQPFCAFPEWISDVRF